jgi:hypothetical protein
MCIWQVFRGRPQWKSRNPNLSHITVVAVRGQRILVEAVQDDDPVDQHDRRRTSLMWRGTKIGNNSKIVF